MPPSEGRVPSVLVLFNTVALYGMERGVIEYFDLIKTELRAHFLVSRTIERLNLPVYQELRRRGFDLSFFSDRRDWPKIGRPRSLRHVGALVAAMLRGNRDVLAASRGCDALYAPSTSYLFFAALAAPWFRLTGRRVIYHFHDLAPRPRWLLRAASPLITDVIHNTEAGRQRIEREVPSLRRARHVVIPSRTDARAAPPRSDATPAMDGAVNVVFVGRITRDKGADVLIDAFCAASFGAAVRLHMIGEAPDRDLLEALRRRTSEAGADVKWWGYVDGVADMMSRADLHVFPTPASRIEESFGRGIAEAMRAGVPSLCFRGLASAELVLHGETGWICDREDAASLASALRVLIGDAEQRRQLGRAARRRYDALFSDEAIRRASGGWLATWTPEGVPA